GERLPTPPRKHNRSTTAVARLSVRAYNNRGADMDNPTIARELLRHARELAADGDNLYRVRAYRQAAGVIQSLDRPVTDLIATSGPGGLRAIPGVGQSLAKTIAELAAIEPLTRAG